MASDAADAFSRPVDKRRKVGDGEKKELDETDDGEKKQEPDESEDADLDLKKMFFGERTSDQLNWLKMHAGKVPPPKQESDVEEEDEVLIQKSLCQYSKQAEASGGFDVDEYPALTSACVMGVIMPIHELSTNTSLLEIVTRLSNLAIEHYNGLHDANYKFVKVVKANTEVVSGVFFYITFEAKIADDDKPEIFQAKVLARVEGDRVDSCWPKSTAPTTT